MRIRVTVKKTSIFPADCVTVFSELQKIETLQYVAAPFASFIPVDGAKEATWEPGSIYRFHFRLFGFIAIGIHEIRVLRFSAEEGIYTNEGNAFVPVWNHEITLRQVDLTHTEYTDRVEIDAGWKTAFVWLWAKAFYAHRQCKWKRLLKNTFMRG